MFHANTYIDSQSTSVTHPTMSARMLTASWLLLHTISASPVQSPDQVNGYCKELDIPVTATASGAIYDIPRIDSNLEATAWAIATSSRNSTGGGTLGNTVISGTYNIHGRLCVPKSSEKSDILQIATHGIGFDSRYWASEYQPEKHSYVAAALKAGYSIFTYDRLGTGQSDHPDAYSIVQAPLQLEVLRQLTLTARNGTLYQLAREADAKFDTPQFRINSHVRSNHQLRRSIRRCNNHRFHPKSLSRYHSYDDVEFRLCCRKLSTI
jgi:hypothetical protein